MCFKQTFLLICSISYSISYASVLFFPRLRPSRNCGEHFISSVSFFLLFLKYFRSDQPPGLPPLGLSWKQDFLILALLTFCAGQFFVVGTEVFIVECLVFTHKMPVVPPQFWQWKMSSDITKCPLGSKITLSWELLF